MGELGEDDEKQAILGHKEDEGNKVKIQIKTKWWVWVVLISALFGVSSAAAALRLMERVPPLMKACWRLQTTSYLLFIGFLYDLYKLLFSTKHLNNEDEKGDAEFTQAAKEKYLTWRTFGVILMSGTALAFHFGTWIMSLNETSMAHSLLFVTSGSIVIVLGSLILRRPISKVWGMEIFSLHVLIVC
jgi:drug/metabolite transporter (DMT)-like permease